MIISILMSKFIYNLELQEFKILLGVDKLCHGNWRNLVRWHGTIFYVREIYSKDL